MPCAFCQILDGSLEAHVVWRDEHTMAFLDHTPLFHGHTLVVPTHHVETLVDLDPGHLDHVFGRARRVAAAVEAVLGAQGSFVALHNRVSQSVPHLHVHVVPRTRGDGLRGFFWPRTKYTSADQAEDVARRLRAWLGDDPEATP